MVVLLRVAVLWRRDKRESFENEDEMDLAGEVVVELVVVVDDMESVDRFFLVFLCREEDVLAGVAVLHRFVPIVVVALIVAAGRGGFCAAAAVVDMGGGGRFARLKS